MLAVSENLSEHEYLLYIFDKTIKKLYFEKKRS